MIEFRPIEMKDREQYNAFALLNDLPVSYYNFTSLFTWRKLVDSQMAVIENCLVVRGRYGQRPDYYHFPLGDGDIKGVVEALIEETKGQLVLLPVMPEMKDTLEKMFPGKFTFTLCRDQFDYVYKSEDLISLRGKKLHAKRNHINKLDRKSTRLNSSH